ncbi:MAG: efflux RND transporter permease subunit [Planctomycetes bacterium]|nr:efflux RND transporter permease subunit [Planctomycetota bacterium]
MFHPLAFTKTFALVGVSILAITLVPAVIPLLVRGRIRGERENWLVRRVIEIYQPVLNFLLDHPWPIMWITGTILIVGLTPAVVGEGFFWFLLRVIVALSMVACVWAARREEDSFRRWWWLVAAIWSLGLFILAISAPSYVVSQVIALLLILPLSFGVSWLLGRARLLAQASMIASLFLVAFIADRSMERLGREFMPPLNEGTIMDMPVTVPRASITQVTDDLKARDEILRMFPEIELVVGKAGRAETPTDPAPPDMVETIINLRPEKYWPKRELRYDDALKQTSKVLAAMETRGWIKGLSDDERSTIINDATMHAIGHFDELMRARALQAITAFETSLQERLTRFAVVEIVEMLKAEGHVLRPIREGEIDASTKPLVPQFGAALAHAPDLVTSTKLAQSVAAQLSELGIVESKPDLLILSRTSLGEVVANVRELLGRKRETFFSRLLDSIRAEFASAWGERTKTLNWELVDYAGPAYTWQAVSQLKEQAEAKKLWHAGKATETSLQALRRETEKPFADKLFLWRKTQGDLVKELDTVLQMPGWGNIWTQPIINRVDMLATGVRTMLGVKVYGDDLDEIQKVSEEVAQVLKRIRGAVDVFPDQIVGEGYLEIDIDRERAARYGVNVGDIQEVVETALGGQTITTTVEGRERFPVRIRYARDFRLDEESVKQLLVSGSPGADMTKEARDGVADASAQQVPLSMVADVRIVEGPSMIKSENGLLRAYVQLNVRDRDIVGFVEEAQRAVAEQVKLPAGMYLEWSGQFEHQLRAKRTLSVIFPIVILVIFLILYITYHDFTDTVLVMGLAVPGAIAGGVLFQYLFGFNFSVAVWVGYIACFGLATENGLVMLVYLREAIDERGGLANMTLAEVRDAVMQGAVHRTRPKLLTEVTTMVGLAPMLWATGTGAEIMQPMAAPVLGGILVSDEVVDLLLPVLFYQVRKWRWRRIHARNTEITGGPKERLSSPELVKV